MSQRKVNVFIVDDHQLIRDGLTHLLNRTADLRICGEAETAAEALAALERSPADVAIVDLSLRDGFGLDLIAQLRRKFRDIAIIVLTMHDERRYAERALRAGARGYIMKGEPAGDIAVAVRTVLTGKLYLSPQVRGLFVEKFVKGSVHESNSPADVLSNRELEVFQLLGRGYQTRRVATELNINIKTVQALCARIKDKLNLANASELMREAVRWNEA